MKYRVFIELDNPNTPLTPGILGEVLITALDAAGFVVVILECEEVK